MSGGYKPFPPSRRELIRPLNDSAHPVLLVKLKESDDSEESREWYEKELASAQEAQVECMTGEIYRYIIGPAQSRIRLCSRDTVESEAVTFHSVRDLHNPKKAARNNYNTYCRAVRNNLDSLARVLFSSIVFEENDLSDANYGLCYEMKGHFPRYGQFIKIDHGQSLNTLRIVEEADARRSLANRHLNHAEIKCFQAKTEHRNRLGDFRTKEGGRTKFGVPSTRKYNLDYDFLDRIQMDFVDGKIDKKYIAKLNYQPSIMPFYDARLLPIIDQAHDDRGQVFNELERHRYDTLSMMALTTNSAYKHLAHNATDSSDNSTSRMRALIEKRIVDVVDNLRECLLKDPDWKRHCWIHRNKIQDMMSDSWARMLRNRRGGVSMRYAADAPGRASDEHALGIVIGIGERLNQKEVLDLTHRLISELRYAIESKVRWSVGTGGTKIHFVRDNHASAPQRKVPHTIARFYRHLGYANQEGPMFFRAVRATVEALDEALSRDRTRRRSDTTAFYKELWGLIQTYGQQLSAYLSNDEIKEIHPLVASAGAMPAGVGFPRVRPQRSSSLPSFLSRRGRR